MSDILRRSFTLLAIAAAAMAALLTLLPAAGHDQLWFLLMARRCLDGAALYGPQIFDSNTPLIVWLSAIPVLLGHSLHLPATGVAKLLVLLCAMAVAVFSASLLPHAWRPVQRSEWPALAFAFIVLFLSVPARDFGQRDALVAFLVLPYILCAATRLDPGPGRTRSALATLLAALAFCLKPQDALIAVTLESALLIRAIRKPASPRSGLSTALYRPEPWILLVCGAAYLLAIRLFTPLYFTQTLPILHSTYWAIGHLSLPQLLWEAPQLVILAAITIGLAFASYSISPPVRALLIAGAGAFAAYLLQGTGWYYQQLPAIGLFGAALTLHLLDLQLRHPLHPPRWIVSALATLCLLGIALTAHFTGYPFTPNRAFAVTSPDPAFFTSLAPGTSVAILTTSVDEAMMPVERYHLTWAQRTNNLWLLPSILRSEFPTPGQPPPRRLTPATIAWLDALQHRWMVEDLNRWQPALILVERCESPAVQCQVLEDRHDNLLTWFQRDPAFTALWAHYRYSGTHDRFDAYIRQYQQPVAISSPLGQSPLQ